MKYILKDDPQTIYLCLINWTLNMGDVTWIYSRLTVTPYFLRNFCWQLRTIIIFHVLYKKCFCDPRWCRKRFFLLPSFTNIRTLKQFYYIIFETSLFHLFVSAAVKPFFDYYVIRWPCFCLRSFYFCRKWWWWTMKEDRDL